MANENISTIDEYGRVVVPKTIREKLKTNDIIFIYDQKNKDVHLVPVRDISEWKGKFKGILKNFQKEHEEDWNDPYRR
jgi:AbrB family looped-hinge helix DNA binding protein